MSHSNVLRVITTLQAMETNFRGHVRQTDIRPEFIKALGQTALSAAKRSAEAAITRQEREAAGLPVPTLDDRNAADELARTEQYESMLRDTGAMEQSPYEPATNWDPMQELELAAAVYQLCRRELQLAQVPFCILQSPAEYLGWYLQREAETHAVMPSTVFKSYAALSGFSDKALDAFRKAGALKRSSRLEDIKGTIVAMIDAVDPATLDVELPPLMELRFIEGAVTRVMSKELGLYATTLSKYVGMQNPDSPDLRSAADRLHSMREACSELLVHGKVVEAREIETLVSLFERGVNIPEMTLDVMEAKARMWAESSAVERGARLAARKPDAALLQLVS